MFHGHCYWGLLVFCATFCVGQEAKQCPANEEFQFCGTACPKTCMNKDEDIICTEQCVSGCFCIPGFVRDDLNVCVPESDCPGKCGVNEVFQSCGTACPETCENTKQPYRPCILKCVVGCFCKPGFVRNKNKKCVLPKDCFKKDCGKNEVYQSCGTACPKTCENKKEPMLCTKQCVSGCFCVTGFVRNKNNVCILESQCPKDSCNKPNEMFSECGNHGCQNTCEEPDLITRCTFLPGCYPGCICKPGFLRRNKKDCVPEKTCILPQPIISNVKQAPQSNGKSAEY